jgi:hypothetical protein
MLLVNVRVILLVEGDTIGEYLHHHIELETLRVYTCMYTMVMDTSIRRRTLTHVCTNFRDFVSGMVTWHNLNHLL